MAAKRSIPTSLFASPDFFELSTDTMRLIFIGIILDADDEGRGSAHPRLLARKLDTHPDNIEHALEELATHGMLQCYEVAGRPYYWLCHWHRYQTLSKPTSSLYPAPPDALPAEQPPAPRETQENPGAARETPSEGEGKRREHEEKGTEAEEDDLPMSITRFPIAKQSSSASVSTLSSETLEKVTEQVASLLNLPMSQELREVVREFLPVTTLSLAGEAIEAQAWITNARRNHTQQAMAPAFFRRWLRRTQQGSQPLTASQQVAREKNRLHVHSSAADHDPYAAYVNKLIEQYNGPEALQRVI